MNLPDLTPSNFIKTQDPKKFITVIAIAIGAGLVFSFVLPAFAWLGIIVAVAGVVIYNILTTQK